MNPTTARPKMRMLPGVVLAFSLVAASVLLGAACADEDSCALASEGCSCTAGAACDPGLTCLSSRCVRAPASPGATPATMGVTAAGGAAGGSGGAAPGGSSGAGRSAVPDAGGAPTPAGNKPLGAACGAGAECAGRLCVASACRMHCDLDMPNDCSAAGGPCVPTTLMGVYSCKGDIKTGHDDENAALRVGDSVMRNLSTLDDTDLFLVRLNRLGTIVMEAQPIAGVDLAVDTYNAFGEKTGSFNTRGLGQAESVETLAMTVTSYIFVVVRNAGNSTGPYSFRVR